jgi:hypothetical protein
LLGWGGLRKAAELDFTPKCNAWEPQWKRNSASVLIPFRRGFSYSTDWALSFNLRCFIDMFSLGKQLIFNLEPW